eukprot:366050-Chlamydomonas_euryale.AAC.14
MWRMQAYMWCEQDGSPPPSMLPAVLAVPWAATAARVGMPPVLVYATYNLLNWRRLDPDGPVQLGNIVCLNVRVPKHACAFSAHVPSKNMLVPKACVSSNMRVPERAVVVASASDRTPVPQHLPFWEPKDFCSSINA